MCVCDGALSVSKRVGVPVKMLPLACSGSPGLLVAGPGLDPVT